MRLIATGEKLNATNLETLIDLLNYQLVELTNIAVELNLSIIKKSYRKYTLEK